MTPASWQALFVALVCAIVASAWVLGRLDALTSQVDQLRHILREVE
jgi:hypothetical protein